MELDDEPERVVLTHMPKKKDEKLIGRPVIIENSFRAMGVDLEEGIESCELVEETLDTEIEWIGSHEPPKFLWTKMWTSGTGYFGNEASPTQFYTYAAIVADIPPFAERTSNLQSTVKITAQQIAPKAPTKTPAKASARAPAKAPVTQKATRKRTAKSAGVGEEDPDYTEEPPAKKQRRSGKASAPTPTPAPVPAPTAVAVETNSTSQPSPVPNTASAPVMHHLEIKKVCRKQFM